MPKRKPRQPRDPYEDIVAKKHKEMVLNAPALCKSQVYNEVYLKLRKDRRLDRFIAVVQHCSMTGLNIEETVKVICKSFPGYIDAKDMTVACFEDMIKYYHEISIAWGYGDVGDDITNIMIKNKALKIIENTDSMDDIVKYHEVFGMKTVVNNEDNKTTVNFNLIKK